jgi:hypothetical protein
MAAYPVIDIDCNSVDVQRSIGGLLSALEDEKIDSKGHILKLGEGSTTLGWLMSFKQKNAWTS